MVFQKNHYIFFCLTLRHVSDREWVKKLIVIPQGLADLSQIFLRLLIMAALLGFHKSENLL